MADPNPGDPASRTGYQPALDGVRAVAVVLVMAFHVGSIAGSVHLPGGWLGVDVFFVLSGYLITSLLLQEWDRAGRVDLRHFYARRLLRLAPLSVLLVVGLFLFHLTGIRQGAGEGGIGISAFGAVSVLAYFSNWLYPTHRADLGALSHAWSLSLEEQFYLVWPTLLLVVSVAVPRFRRLVLGAAALTAVVVMSIYRRVVWQDALAWNAHNPFAYGLIGPHRMGRWLALYVGSFTRTDGLLLGCLLGLALSRVRTPGTALKVVGALAGLAGVVTAVIVVRKAELLPYSEFIPMWGLTAFNLASVGVLLHLVTSPRGPLARVLSVRPAVWVGRRAYGIYLTHPIVLDLVQRADLSHPLVAEAITIAATLLAAALSYRFVEQPFLRRKGRYPAAAPVAVDPAAAASLQA